MRSSSRPNCTMTAPERPQASMAMAMTAPPMPLPISFEPHISRWCVPARRRQDVDGEGVGGDVLEGSEAVVDEDIQPSRRRFSVRSPSRRMPISETAMRNSAAMIQKRRRPIERIVTVSMRGPQTSLKVQGSSTTAVSSPASPSPTPRSVR